MPVPLYIICNRHNKNHTFAAIVQYELYTPLDVYKYDIF